MWMRALNVKLARVEIRQKQESKTGKNLSAKRLHDSNIIEYNLYRMYESVLVVKTIYFISELTLTRQKQVNDEDARRMYTTCKMLS